MVGRTPDGSKFSASVPLVRRDADADTALFLSSDPAQLAVTTAELKLLDEPDEAQPPFSGTAQQFASGLAPVSFVVEGRPWSARNIFPPENPDGIFEVVINRAATGEGGEVVQGWWESGRRPRILGARATFRKSSGELSIYWPSNGARAHGLMLPWSFSPSGLQGTRGLGVYQLPGSPAVPFEIKF
jgi:hypothetical protein